MRRLLITTQVVDSTDPYTSFFVGWLRALSGRFDHIDVICLKQGNFDLPKNIAVHSLGKESGQSRFKYIRRFYTYVWRMRHEYDVVLVHMNQEYVLLGGLFWKLWGKKVYLWRNHYAGSFFTDSAAWFCTRVFCTSHFSYTAMYSKTVFMPVGVDLTTFKKVPLVERVHDSVLFFGRFAPSKRPHVLVEALNLLKDRGTPCRASIYGDALPSDGAYFEDVNNRVQQYRLVDTVQFKRGVPNMEAPRIFNSHEIFVDLGSSGMYNKTIFEAAACGCMVITASKDVQAELGDTFYTDADDARALADKLHEFLTLDDSERTLRREMLMQFAQRNSLERLGERLAQEIRV